MHKNLAALVVSCRMENRKTLVHAFEGLPVNGYCATTVRQGNELLASHSFEIVFCEQRLPDGSYRELLVAARAVPRKVRFVVVLSSIEQDERIEALRLGAQEVLRSPLQPADVDIALIHASKDYRDNAEAKEFSATA